MPDFECREIDWVLIRELGLRLSLLSFWKGECTILKTVFLLQSPDQFAIFFFVFAFLFTFLIVQSYLFTDRLAIPISD